MTPELERFLRRRLWFGVDYAKARDYTVAVSEDGKFLHIGLPSSSGEWLRQCFVPRPAPWDVPTHE